MRDMRFGTWNVRSLYRAGSFIVAAREFVRYKLDIVCVQEVRWDREGTVRAEDYNFDVLTSYISCRWGLNTEKCDVMRNVTIHQSQHSCQG
jgi:exonuclease III